MSSDAQPRSLSDALSSLPAVYGGDLRSLIRTKINNTGDSIPLLVVLDDDPTGTQTCHDINVLTQWDVSLLSSTFTSDLTTKTRGFFILTNSRALHPPEAKSLIAEICNNLLAASKATGTDFEVVLRSDSTLRGHFPLEAEVSESALDRKADCWILAPFFLQGGRYTIDDVHYVAEGDKLVPAGQTPFAQDASFGYKSSNLRDWVVEKSRGSINANNVKALSLTDIRSGGPDEICKQLLSFSKGSVVVVNAAAEEDMDVVVLGILEAASRGRRFLYRSGAALVSARLGIKPIPPKSADALHLDKNVGGLIIAGSYVPKTTAQLKALREKAGDKLTTIELQVDELLESETSANSAVSQAIHQAEGEIQKGQDVLVMTSRKLITGKDERESLNIGGVIARNLVRFLQELKTRPRYVIAKGGITSSDMATKGLKMRRATVIGQAAPGVPLWECFEDTSKWAGIPYIVFPGNVGSEDTLFEVVRGWQA
ncbi:hypothetical protein LTS08_005193 [Lithohypha guttulata]|uniref:Uncharacterized protein n=1 Tax=Lithohypha guttulata TaxID=1690604 RepID=A0AAN7T813_9EURO|nr:hypothetical protein LTR51_004824 [Lithohypha guttulata]KAK5091435.1 hypothetical protein LTR05_001618 [Lithohypha guttulata]KAK5100444.1 hypothetical protein LTS08_005193 [Lithohypha guttulata]